MSNIPIQLLRLAPVKIGSRPMDAPVRRMSRPANPENMKTSAMMREMPAHVIFW